MYQIVHRKQSKKWRSCILLSNTLSEIERFCKSKKTGFANPSQFINFAIRKELDRRKNQN